MGQRVETTCRYLWEASLSDPHLNQGTNIEAGFPLMGVQIIKLLRGHTYSLKAQDLTHMLQGDLLLCNELWLMLD